MPELPEVETIKRALIPHLLKRRIVAIEAHIETLRYSLTPLKSPDLIDRKIISVRRRGRYLIIELDNLRALVTHLGMSGSIRVVPRDEKRIKHEHVIIILDNGETMRFHCPRRFGFIRVVSLSSVGATPEELNHLGPEPLSDNFDAAYLYRITRGRAVKIKNLIMDNKAVVGVGNIYAAEALFQSRLSPLRKASELTRRQADTLATAIKQVLLRSIEAGGTTIADYKSVDGSEGRFVRELQIYGKAGQPCPECGAEIMQQRLGGRSSCYCPKCQK